MAKSIIAFLRLRRLFINPTFEHRNGFPNFVDGLKYPRCRDWSHGMNPPTSEERHD